MAFGIGQSIGIKFLKCYYFGDLHGMNMVRKRKRRSIDFSDEEWALVLDRAQKSGASDRSAFIRAMALYAVPNQKIKHILGAK